MSQECAVPKMHSVVAELLEDFAAKDGAVSLPADRVKHWAAVVHGHADCRAIGVDIIALAITFANEKLEEACEQLVGLAVVALGSAEVASALERSGMESASAKALVGKLEPKTRSLTRGLAAPSAGSVSARRNKPVR